MVILFGDVALTSWVLSVGGGLEGAALCMGLTHLGYTMLQVRLTLGFFGAGRLESLQLMAKLCAPFLACAAISIGLDLAWSDVAAGA